MIKGEEESQGNRRIGIVNHLYNSKDCIIQLYPMELHCEGITTANEDEKKNQLNPSATEFHPKGTAAEVANGRLQDIAMEDDDGDI